MFMDIEKIGKFIKELRIENNYSQNSLSEEIHVTRQAISNWENGKSLPDSNILIELSNLFNVSINEILSGKRMDKEDNLEEIALSLIDDNNKKRSRIKLLLTSLILSTFILVTLFLGYYFINNYNSIKVYKVIGNSENFKTNDGILITTKNKSYIRLGRIVKFEKAQDIEINKLKLYYKDKNNKENIIFESEKTEVLINDDYGYNEFLVKNNIIKNSNSLFLEIEYNNSKCDVIKLHLYPKFKNDFKSINGNNSVSIVKEKIDKDTKNDEEDLVNKIKMEEIEKAELKLKLREEVKVENNDIPQQITNNVITNEQQEDFIEGNIIDSYEPVLELTIPEDNNLNNEFDLVIEKINDIIKSITQNTYYDLLIENKMAQLVLKDNILYIDAFDGLNIEVWQYNCLSTDIYLQKSYSTGEEEKRNYINNDNNPESLDVYYTLLNYLEVLSENYNL